MAKKNGTPQSIGPVAQPQSTDAGDPFINAEYGIERVLPFHQWSTDGEVARIERISLDELVDMRRRDGQARALARLFVLPILSALADGEWVLPDNVQDSAEEEDPEKEDSSEVGDAAAAKASEAEDTEDTDPAEPEEAPGEEEVAFANMMWNLPPQAGGMTTSKTSIVKKLLQGITDGFAVFEEVRQIPQDGPLKGKIVLRKLAYRDPRTIRFRVDANGGFNGIRQVAELGGRTVDVQIPKEKIFFWTCNAEENLFYGVSMFEAAYEHYQIKKKLYYIAHLAAQFAAVPGRIGEIPHGADPRHVLAFKQSLANFAFNTSMVAPPGFKVTPFSGNSGFDFLKLIDHHNHMMSKSVLSSFLDSEQRTALIDNSAGDPSTDFFVMALESIMDDIAEHLTTYLMPKYMDWNFGTKVYPVFKFGALSDTAKASIKEVFQAVVTSSVLNSTPEFVRELEKKLAKEYDLDIDYDEIERQEQEAAEEEASKAEEEAEAFRNAPQEDPMAPAGGEEQAPVAPKAGGVQPQQPPGVPVSLTNPNIDDLVESAVLLLSTLPVDEGAEEI